MTENPSDRFVVDELFSLVVQAALGRSKTYKDELPESERRAFRDGLRRALDAVVEGYVNPVSSDDHIDNIRRLADDMSEKFRSSLHDGRFRVGSSQKALNLYLKYLWCLGKISRPPHCPFDAVIISQLGIKNPRSWTQLDDIGEYKTLVEFARRAAGGKELADWELNTYNSKRP